MLSRNNTLHSHISNTDHTNLEATIQLNAQLLLLLLLFSIFESNW